MAYGTALTATAYKAARADRIAGARAARARVTAVALATARREKRAAAAEKRAAAERSTYGVAGAALRALIAAGADPENPYGG